MPTTFHASLLFTPFRHKTFQNKTLRTRISCRFDLNLVTEPRLDSPTTRPDSRASARTQAVRNVGISTPKLPNLGSIVKSKPLRHLNFRAKTNRNQIRHLHESTRHKLLRRIRLNSLVLDLRTHFHGKRGVELVTSLRRSLLDPAFQQNTTTARGPIIVAEIEHPTTPSPQSPDDLRRQRVRLVLLSQSPWQLIVFILIGIAIDRWRDTFPWATVICSAVGMVTTIYSIIRIATPRSKP